MTTTKAKTRGIKRKEMESKRQEAQKRETKPNKRQQITTSEIQMKTT
jgi:hypothetical protein